MKQSRIMENPLTTLLPSSLSRRSGEFWSTLFAIPRSRRCRRETDTLEMELWFRSVNVPPPPPPLDSPTGMDSVRYRKQPSLQSSCVGRSSRYRRRHRRSHPRPRRLLHPPHPRCPHRAQPPRYDVHETLLATFETGRQHDPLREVQ
jgi:hypothetical protein